MTTEAQSIADLATRAHGAPTIIKTDEGRVFLVTPNDQTARDVTEPNAVDPILPDHIKQAVTLQTVDSLVDYLNRFKTDDTMLFANIVESKIAAAVDYHSPNTAAHVAHRAVLQLQLSEEWKIWNSINGKLLPPLEFARFIEENAGDIESPTAADILDVTRDLHAVRNVNFNKAVRTSSDVENFEYTDNTELKSRGGVEVPTKFRLRIPVYFGELPTGLNVFLRWSLDDGKLFLGIKLNQVEQVRQAVFKQIVLEAAGQTERPAMFGALGA